ncbi:MAG: hypothetical protein ACRCVJ_12875 [Clostridium sp.]|uniref:hypothetical protein n=1 Tax=Clostridium sp. TaxID=1506 RepID=UPI003F2D89D9
MYGFTTDEIIIIVKEIITILKEEELYGYIDDENFDVPLYIQVKLDNLCEKDYIQLFSILDLIAKNVLLDYSNELNSLNMLHEKIINELSTYN